jgi:hypothetical protein
MNGPVGDAVPVKSAKHTNDDFCPQCGQTFPRDQRDYHLMEHHQAMNKEVLGALEGIRQELARRNSSSTQSM